MENINEYYLSDRQLAERFSVSRQTIWRWTRQGVLPAPVHIGPAARWRHSDIAKAVIEAPDHAEA
jgi:prophage regulatory protein